MMRLNTNDDLVEFIMVVVSFKSLFGCPFHSCLNLADNSQGKSHPLRLKCAPEKSSLKAPFSWNILPFPSGLRAALPLNVSRKNREAGARGEMRSEFNFCHYKPEKLIEGVLSVTLSFPFR